MATAPSDRHGMRSSRRTLLAAGAAAGAAAVGALALGRRASAKEDEKGVPASTALPLTVAGYPYDRVRALQDGRVGVAGCDVTFEVDGIGSLNTHVFSGPQTRAVSEIGLLPYLLAWCNGGFRDYDLLPVFVLRFFRHKSIFIRTDRGIRSPEDLRGRRLATPGYSSTSLTWIRGILKDEYGLSPGDFTWVITRKDSAADVAGGGASTWERRLPSDLKVEDGPEGKDESDLLVEGKVDALLHAAEPKAYVEGHPKVGRLFPDPRRVEQAYLKKTGIFPIMHAVVLRHDLAQEHPQLPKAVFEAYARAKQADAAQMHKVGAFFSTLPWYRQELEETQNLMGERFYSYGIPGNRTAVETLFRYAFEQGLAKRRVEVDEIFHPSTLELREPSD